ncbi:helix-turn-helix domain-containing protein [Polaribacter cellanae]|uniref:Helix-turn-helix transcriptional regulator n=1 Tax=Polaribacter cellanae TaxID=2818493 RepID=A0A975CM20_9FLAO|nr:helix-turn-helix transcriptional regulator [Polaribacter cellanae]QTE21099.1 helix-turn-helix transcriptional regulator [Polaribacter cellanae]
MANQEDFIKEQQEKLGKRFRELRIAKGYTNYEQFAFEHRIPRAQYGRYEKGSDLRFSSLVKILKAMDISLEEFFKGM